VDTVCDIFSFFFIFLFSILFVFLLIILILLLLFIIVFLYTFIRICRVGVTLVIIRRRYVLFLHCHIVRVISTANILIDLENLLLLFSLYSSTTSSYHFLILNRLELLFKRGKLHVFSTTIQFLLVLTAVLVQHACESGEKLREY
jgi:hypothetical protein